MGIIDHILKKKEEVQSRIKKNALDEAKRVAHILGEKFGAKEVILYGSLSQNKNFDVASDIDLAVKGLGDKYLSAYGYCIRLSKFNLDIKAYEDMPNFFRHKVNIQGKRLYEKK